MFGEIEIREIELYSDAKPRGELKKVESEADKILRIKNLIQTFNNLEFLGSMRDIVRENIENEIRKGKEVRIPNDKITFCLDGRKFKIKWSEDRKKVEINEVKVPKKHSRK